MRNYGELSAVLQGYFEGGGLESQIFTNHIGILLQSRHGWSNFEMWMSKERVQEDISMINDFLEEKRVPPITEEEWKLIYETIPQHG